MLKPVSESLKLVQSGWEMEKERVGAYTDLKTQIRYILSGNEALKMKPPGFPRLCTTTAFAANGEAPTAPRGGTGGNGGVLRFHDSGNPFQEEERVRPFLWSFTFLEAVPSSLTRMASYLNAGQTENRKSAASGWPAMPRTSRGICSN